jgi:hypothetical protein
MNAAFKFQKETPSRMLQAAFRGNPGTFKLRVVLFLLIIACGKAWAVDEFAGLKCGTDIPKSLVGKRDSNERVAVLEERHKDLGLKNLGGTEISDRSFLASWQICGSEYQLLVNTKSGLIRDVLPFPAHSKASPMFIGSCQAAGRKVPHVVAVLNNRAGYDARDEKLAKTMLKATAAWTINEIKGKFVKQPTEIQCPLEGIVTADGGP